MIARTRWMNLWMRCAVALALSLFAFTLSASARADAFSQYQLVGSFSLPTSAGPFDALPDGRLVVLVNATVRVETSAGSHTFSTVGTLPSADISSFGAAFLRVSPNGSKIAVGNNGGASFTNYQVGVFVLSSLSGSWFSASHFDGEWIDERYVALTAGTFGSPSIVTALDTTSPVGSPSNTVLVNNIGGASAGIAFDAAHNLFTGNGFADSDPGGTGTGAVRAVSQSAWQAALAGGPAVNFETQAVPIIDILSASPLAFDGEGNLLIGGGDGATDVNFAAIARASAVAAARAGGGQINAGDAANVRRLDPDPASNFYTVSANPSRGEMYLNDFGSPTVYVYRSAPVAAPAMPAWALAVFAMALVTASSRKLRRAA